MKKMKPIDYRVIFSYFFFYYYILQFLNLWRVFKITETFNNDTEKTLEYYHKRNFGGFLFPLISRIAYEALPHPEPG